jgi:hypothetical protein
MREIEMKTWNTKRWLGLSAWFCRNKALLLGISKRGDTYLRTLLVHGARSVPHHVKEPGPWVEQIRKRRPPNVVILALANKMARTIWASVAHDRPYQKGHESAKPA